MQILKEVGLDGLKTAAPASCPAASSSAWRGTCHCLRAVAGAGDEPTANLDSITATALMELLVHMNTEHNVTFIFSLTTNW